MEKYLVVIPYLASGAQGKELEYAIAGWRKHFKEQHQIVVVGDYAPIVDSGKDITFIECKRVDDPHDGNYLPHLDIMNKLKTVREHFPDSKGIIWVADDCYAVNDFDIIDVKFLKVLEQDIKFNENSTNGWRRAKAKTKKLLVKEGYPSKNFSTHLPRWYEWDKLEALWKKYDLFHHDYITEDLYFNIYYKDRVPFQLNKDTDNIKCGVYEANFPLDKLKNAFKSKIWITNSPVGWIPDLPKLLEKHYK